jgi:hypothetical protein
MALSDHDQSNIREYLLGKLSDEEQQAIEERLMLDDDLFQELEISKGELIEKYSAGELGQKEQQWFESHYLASPEGTERRLFAVALDTLGRRQPAPKPVGLFNRIAAFFTQRSPLAGLATAGVIVAVAIGVWIRSTTPRSSLAVTLTNNIVKRSATESPYQRISLKRDIGELRISLVLPESVRNAAKYRVELDNRAQIKSLTPAGSDGNSVLVLIPAQQVPDGLYALMLYAIQSDGNEQAVPGQYFFEVERTD